MLREDVHGPDIVMGTNAVQQAAAAKLRVTVVGGTFSGGVIETEVFYVTGTAPTS
jgi:hypothetical protein